jgi:hypothetical protein
MGRPEAAMEARAGFDASRGGNEGGFGSRRFPTVGRSACETVSAGGRDLRGSRRAAWSTLRPGTTSSEDDRPAGLEWPGRAIALREFINPIGSLPSRIRPYSTNRRLPFLATNRTTPKGRAWLTRPRRAGPGRASGSSRNVRRGSGPSTGRPSPRTRIRGRASSRGTCRAGCRAGTR